MRTVFRQHLPRRPRFIVCAALGVTLAFVAPPASAATARGLAPARDIDGRRAVTIHGQVVDSTSNAPVVGVSVQVEGTSLGAVTDSAGRYSVVGVAAGTQTLVARRLGYAPRRRTVTVGTDGDLTVDFALTPTPTSLNAVIVTGTAGGQQERTLGTSIGNVNAPDVLAKSQAPDMSSLLNSRVAGVSIVPSTGRLGAGPNIEIRGISSLSLDNQPLIYIDGVRVSNRTGGGPTTFGNGGFGAQNAGVVGRLNDINPDEIESIQIIKGPAAATIYGTEAANGVIQIITKKGASESRSSTSRFSRAASTSGIPKGACRPTLRRTAQAPSRLSMASRRARQRAAPIFTTGKTYDSTTRRCPAGLRSATTSSRPTIRTSTASSRTTSSRQFSAHANLNLTPEPKYANRDEPQLRAGQLPHRRRRRSVGHARCELAQPHIFAVPGADGFYPNVPPNVPQTLFDNSDDIQSLHRQRHAQSQSRSAGSRSA